MSLKFEVREEEQKNNEIITMICCGKSGVGKSTIGNQILTKIPTSNLFKSEATVSEYGVTKKIQGEVRMINLPNGTQRKVQYLDIPGMGDPTINVQGLVDEIKDKYQQSKINIGLLLINSFDIRKSLQEAFSCAFFRSFFEQNGLSSKQFIYLVITRWQQCQMTDQEIDTKLKSFAEDGLEIDPSRVIKYRLGESNDLLPLFTHIQELNSQFGYNFKNNLNQGLCQFQQEIDAIVGRNIELRCEMEEMKKLISNLESTNQNILEQSKQNKEAFEKAMQEQKIYNEQLLSQIEQMGDDDGGFCNLI